MTPSAETSIELTQWILSAGLIHQGIESLVTRREFYGSGPILNLLFSARIFLPAALLLPASATGSLVPSCLQFLLLLTSIAMTHRLRGPLCGGSDSMFFQVQIGLLTASLGFLAADLPKLGLAWIAVQSILSYLLAGWVKIRNLRWRNGAAVQSLLGSNGPYVVHEAFRSWARMPRVCLGIAWATILLEFALSSSIFMPALPARLLLLAGFVFHLMNAMALGLNRFVWAWTATYPALWYGASLVSSGTR